MRSRSAWYAELSAGSFMIIAVIWLLGGMPVVATAATATTREDPILTGLGVKIEMQGGPTIFTNEISGLGSESEVIEQKAATPTGQTILQSLPGRIKWKEIIVRRALTSDKSFATWRAQVETGNLKGAIFNFSITLLGATLQPVARWEGVGGWPSKLNIIFPSFDRTGPAGTPVPVVLEELTIVHSGLVRTQ